MRSMSSDIISGMLIVGYSADAAPHFLPTSLFFLKFSYCHGGSLTMQLYCLSGSGGVPSGNGAGDSIFLGSFGMVPTVASDGIRLEPCSRSACHCAHCS